MHGLVAGVREWIVSVRVQIGISGVYDVEGLGRARVRRRRCASVEIIWDAMVSDGGGEGGMGRGKCGVVRRVLYVAEEVWMAPISVDRRGYG